ncbi:MAG: alpha/beta hydrolase [Alphaproteobacteria bacterium]|nr:alpha/beta hydrolase [Alphaproteobacteria bacterium]
MRSFLSDGIEIAYDVFGEGRPVLMIHGFGSNSRVNWIDTGWVQAVTGAGYQAIVLDNRGHGRSQKLYDPALYSSRLMAHDPINLLDHLHIGKAALIGYSMGARIAAFAALDAPDRVAAAIIGGLGIRILEGLDTSAEIAAALRAESLSSVKGRIGRQYRIFAEHTGSDLEVLAVCMEAGRSPFSTAMLAELGQPILVAVGSKDDIAGPAEPLAARIDKGEALVIDGRDHMRATGDKQFKAGALSFLGRVY